MTNKNAIAIELEGVQKVFDHPVPTPVLKHVDLCIKRGESVAIMGASGEGKSTLLNILGTLETASAGTIKILGHKVSARMRALLRNQHIGFIFQSFHLLGDYSAIQNVLMPASIARQSISPGSSAYRRAESLLNEVGLRERMHYSAKLLSGGEKQRVAIARALCNDPEIILADEPSGNLDHACSQQIHSLLFRFAKEANRTLIVVTHDNELAALCDRCLILQDGILRLPLTTQT